MVNTKIIGFYITFLIIFGTFAGLFVFGNTGESFDYKKYLVVSKVREKLSMGDGFISNIISASLIPFLLIDALMLLLAFVGVSFSYLPTLLNVIVFTPLGLMVIFDYVLPYVRGN